MTTRIWIIPTLVIFTLILNFHLHSQVVLDVEGETSVKGNYIELIKPSDVGHLLRLSSEGAAMNINATTDLYLNSGGNILLDANNASAKVGLGTAAPQTKLHVVGDRIMLEDVNDSNRSMIFRVDGSGMDIDVNGGELYFNAHNNLLLNAFNTDAKVGIGHVAPEEKLDLQGELMVRDDSKLATFRSSGDNGFLEFQTNSGVTGANIGYYRGGANLAYFYINTPSGDFGEFVVKDNGRVGIRSVSPITTLWIKHENTGVQNGNGIGLLNSGTGKNWEFYVNGGDLTLWTGLGNLQGCFDETSGNYTPSSDKNLKKNIKKLPDQQLQKINQLRPVSYHFKDRPANRKVYGFIAQEVQKLYPDQVIIAANDEEGKPILGLSYTEMIPILTAGIQEQQEQIEKQEQTIDMLKSQIEAKTQNIEELNERLSKVEQLLEQLLASTPSTNTSQEMSIETARLFQIHPNPFDQKTTISFFIPETVQTASLQIASKDGKIVKIIELPQKGNGQVELEVSTLASGTYYCTLAIGGIAVDTKLLVLSP